MKTMKKTLAILIKALISAAVIFAGYWIMLPPLNLRSTELYGFMIFVIIAVTVVFGFGSVFKSLKEVNDANDRNSIKAAVDKFKRLKTPFKISVCAILLVIVVMLVGTVIGAQIFNASSYNTLMTMQNGDFVTEVSEIGKEQIPVVDKDTASRLGQRKLGEMADLVSQFEIDAHYTQINFKGRPVRVTPLRYGDAIKWLGNRAEGIPAYIMVDMTTQDTTLVRLNEGIKYSESEYFMRDLMRKLRFAYPTKIFDDITFEIDDNGTPFWVASTVEYRIGLFSGTDIGGAVLLNAQTGESVYYDIKDIPTWVDQVYSADLVLTQLAYNGKYRSGWLNSVFGQKGVLQPTDGYNYLAINDDVWLYTGITSVTSDESNVGFVLTNLRTKETRYYPVPGAEEFSAMSSAEGQVQHLSYTATFPLLLNVADRPSYFMALKDSAGLVKMYAFVDVQQYQIVGTGSTVEESRIDYLNKLKKEDVDTSVSEKQSISGTVEKISSAVVDGNTCYYIMLKDNDTVFTVPVTLSDKLPFVGAGDTVTLTYSSDSMGVTVSAVEIN
ncbi:MAG: CvpA family protein [Clostridia bacterium]|nr:CvpA family protein [Clostridia bacterium]